MTAPGDPRPAPLVGVVPTLLVLALPGVFASVSCALTLKSEDAFAPLFDAVALPGLLLSGIPLPRTLAPVRLALVALGWGSGVRRFRRESG